MLVYNYDEETKEYTYSVEAEKDPEESRVQGKFIPLVPANATLDEPLDAKSGMAVVFINDTWQYMPDHRDEIVINPETGEKTIVDYLGAIKDGFIDYETYINSDEYKEKLEQEEKERIKLLSMTKLDFVNSLDEYGITYYDDIVPLLNANLEAKKQWELCERVYRFNPLLDELAGEFNITSEQLDEIFKKRGQ